MCWFQATNFDDDGGLFDDIATEVMQDHGIDLSDVKDRSFKDALILVHEAKSNAQKKLNEILFYLKPNTQQFGRQESCFDYQGRNSEH